MVINRNLHEASHVGHNFSLENALHFKKGTVLNGFTHRVGIKKPTQKNPPKKTQKNPPKKPTKSGFFLGFLGFFKFFIFYKNNKNFSLSN
jgi:hypothetical protein